MSRVSGLVAAALGAGLIAATMGAGAQSLPEPGNRAAPGNTMPATPPRQAGYGSATNYQLECAGCHLTDGQGARRNDVPRMTDFVGQFLEVQGGREFLARVPGVAQSSFTDAQLAELLNWLLRSDIAGDSTPATFKPYTEDEIHALRADPLDSIQTTRNALLERMREQGLAINDGLADRP